MSQITTVEITHGRVRAEVELEYRWYVPGNDPWRRVTGSSSAMPASGDWENRAIGGGSSSVRMFSPRIGPVLRLLNFTGVRVGSRGDGEFYASGYTIPEFSIVKWRVLSIV